MNDPRSDIKAVYTAAIGAVNPAAAVRRHLNLEGRRLEVMSQGKIMRRYDLDEFDRVLVVGCGKATAPMAGAVEEMLGERISKGCILVKYGYTEPLRRIEVLEAAHPVPDEKGMAAAGRVLGLLRDATSRDLVISLISGGGSALLVLPPPSISLAEKGDTTGLLLKSGAAIHEVNAVRKHLSLVKGGNLAAAAYPATVLNLMISDVVGDPMDVIASGPFVPDPSSFATALGILDRYTLRDRVPPSVREYIEAGIEGKAAETPKEGNEVFERVTNVIVASNIIALQSAQQEALRLGYNTVVLSSGFEGETRDVAFFHAAVAREARHSGNPVAPPACIISGGETTVTVRGGGLGGRNMEFALQSALFLDGIDGIDVASVGTDGTDGPTDAAGAFADGGTVRRARAKGLDIRVYGENSDSYNFFKALGDLIVTGPTNTNVMDMHIFVVR